MQISLGLEFLSLKYIFNYIHWLELFCKKNHFTEVDLVINSGGFDSRSLL